MTTARTQVRGVKNAVKSGVKSAMQAEAVVHALRTHQVDAIVGDRHVMFVRLKQAELELERSRDELRALAARLELQRENERAEIAREIHDELGQSLTSLQLGMAWLSQATHEPAVRVKLQSMSTLVATTIRSVRNVAVRLRPGVLDELGLVKTLRAEARSFKEHTGIPCTFETNLRNVVCDRAGSLAVFRIVQSALTNVARHARASRAVIVLRKTRHDLVVTVKDNGRGISSTLIDRPGACGIIGMRERALALDGTLALGGAPGKGTQLTVQIPLSRVIVSRATSASATRLPVRRAARR